MAGVSIKLLRFSTTTTTEQWQHTKVRPLLSQERPTFRFLMKASQSLGLSQTSSLTDLRLELNWIWGWNTEPKRNSRWMEKAARWLYTDSTLNILLTLAYPLENQRYSQLYGASTVSLSNSFIVFGGYSYPNILTAVNMEKNWRKNKLNIRAGYWVHSK